MDRKIVKKNKDGRRKRNKDRQTERKKDQIFTCSSGLVTLYLHNIVFIIRCCFGSSRPDKLQRALGNIMADCLPVERSPASTG